MKEIEDFLFECFSQGEPELIFILGSPRTGSTLLYQALINALQPFYFANMVNDYFSEHPVVGAAMISLPKEVPYKSAYGKTKDPLGPSEASLTIRNWFGGQHPSQTKSCEVIPEKKGHLLATMRAIYAMHGPILIKNAWNCFRVKNLSKLFPNSKFVWVRRDIAQSANSDLKARIHRGSPYIWNSATTSNYKEIQKLPYWEQVVEQQYEYNKAIAKDMQEVESTKIWYEDLCAGKTRELRLFLGIETLPKFEVSQTQVDKRVANYARKYEEYRYVPM